MKYYARAIYFALAVLFALQSAAAADRPSENIETTEPASAETIVAELSDQEVRRLLIEAIKKEAETGIVPTSAPESLGGLAEFIENIKERVSLIQARIALLKAGQRAEVGKIEHFFNYLGKDEPKPNPTQAILSVFLVLLAAFLVELLFWGGMISFRRRLQSAPANEWRAKTAKLVLGTLMDMLAVIVFIAAAILIFYLFLDRTHSQRVLVATYLSATVIVRIVVIVSRFFLMPKMPSLRFLPLSDAASRHLHRWIIAITLFSSFGFLTCGVMRLAGSSEAAHIKALFSIGLIIATMLIAMILQNKQTVAESLGKDLAPESVSARLVSHWHQITIFGVLLLVAISTVNMIMGNYGGYLAIRTLLIIPLYFLFDWILRQILKPIFGFVTQVEKNHRIEASSPPSIGAGAAEIPVDEPSDQDAPASLIKPIEFDRIKNIIHTGLRIALAALFMIWALSIWGIDLTIGKAVAGATFNILIVILLCYVGWEFLNAAIQRRLKLEMPDDDEEMEEGGAGGSRIGTLLLLLRKFIMVVIVVLATMIILSALGVNIGPLIAGAGVLGLAIGFGAQTLVKDIISGVFFLIDDAFRVGDYVEISGAKGTVEHISLRSLKLRHHRGMVNTIPFGDIATITNYSRDYIITKLDFRVRYDTDVEKVRKIIKKRVYKVILKNEELGPKLLGKIKSQGVRQLDDSAMIMRIKYKTIPGEQFVIRKEVYRLLQEAFKVEGIEFAHKNVTVYLPPESSQTHQNGAIAAGAAAVAAAEEGSP